MTDDKQKRLVRFDFPPGASFKEIAEAIEAMRAKYREEKKARDEARLTERMVPNPLMSTGTDTGEASKPAGEAS